MRRQAAWILPLPEARFHHAVPGSRRWTASSSPTQFAEPFPQPLATGHQPPTDSVPAHDLLQWRDNSARCSERLPVIAAPALAQTRVRAPLTNVAADDPAARRLARTDSGSQPRAALHRAIP